MGIWCLIILLLVIILILSLKLIVMKRDIKNIDKYLNKIINTDTNNLLTINSNDKSLKKLSSSLNRNLKKLRELELEYKNGNKDLRTSITNISHDLRTLLTAIMGYLDLINNDNLTNKQLKYLSIIDNKLKDIIELTEQLFDFSKTLDIETELMYEVVCINDVLEDVIASSYSLFVSKNIKPQLDICVQEVVRKLNPNVLKRIFENIISNAIKYSDGNLKIRLNSDGVIEFSNKTYDLDSVSLEKIFDRYYTVKSAKKSSGIGLSIAKQLVDLSGGKIDAIYKKNILTIRIKF